MGGIISSLKEFIWDVIGYLIPGFFLIIVANFILEPCLFSEGFSYVLNWSLFGDYLIVVLSYIFGFIVYSVTKLKIKTQDSVIIGIEKLYNKYDENWFIRNTKGFVFYFITSKRSSYWEDRFRESSTFELAKKFLKKEGYDEVNVDGLKINEIRNILMSRNPDMDEKVYTFMFRSSVFDHISTIFILTFTVFFLQLILRKIGFEITIIKNDDVYNIFYVILLFLIPLLGNSKRMFYSISQRIPFSNLK